MCIYVQLDVLFVYQLNGNKMRENKFIDWWFSGRCLKHPIVVAVAFYLIGYAVGRS